MKLKQLLRKISSNIFVKTNCNGLPAYHSQSSSRRHFRCLYYYEQIQSGLGDRFLAELLVRFNEISKHPQYYSFIDDQQIIRDIKLKSFPYLVVYEIEDDKVIIYSVHCGYRNPDKRIRK